MYLYGIAPDFGAIVPKKRADIVGAYYIDIYTYIALLQILGQLFPKNGQILWRFTTYTYIYDFAPIFGAIVPKKRADIVGVYYKYVHL